jgi:hypothetical protein
MRLPLRDNLIRQTLENYPQALPLYTKARDFYRDRVSFWQNEIVDGPVGEVSFTFDSAEPGHLELAVADVSIRITDPRAPLSIIHELLHLELRVKGFPLPNPKDQPSFPEDDFAPFWSIFNSVDHHLFKERFVEMGFAPADIVRETKSSRERMLSRWTDELIRCDDAENTRRAMYAYFQCWMTDALRETSCEVPAFRHAMQADLPGCLDAIRANVPDIEKEMNWLHDWFTRREFASPLLYRQSVSEAADKMHIPIWPLYSLSTVDGSIRAVPC